MTTANRDRMICGHGSVAHRLKSEVQHESESLLTTAARSIEGWLLSDSEAMGLDGGLRVKKGGRQSQFGPVPWMSTTGEN